MWCCHIDDLREVLLTAAEAAGPPLSKTILNLLEAIRKHALHRATYLNFLPKPDTILAELPPDAYAEGGDDALDPER